MPNQADSTPASSTQPVIELHDLGVWYRLKTRRNPSLKQILLRRDAGPKSKLLWALREINLTCHEGEVLGVIGLNGAGKSTLCLVLSQILAPDEGELTVRGRVSALLTLGAGFNKDLSGRANIIINASFLGIPRKQIEALMDRIIEFSELGEFIDQPIRTYSSGMRSRLAFSVASTINPDILILDEVLAVGDRAFRMKSQKRLEEMMHQSRLIIIVSHSSSFISETCTHCLWLDHGRMKMYGSAQEVVEHYNATTGGPEKD